MHRPKWIHGLSLSLVFALGLLLTLSIAGCTDKDRERGDSSKDLATVNLYFDLTTMPQNCQYYHITCLQLNEETRTLDATRDQTKTEQIVPITEVPTTTNLIQILYRETEDGETVATSKIENVKLDSSKPNDYRQGEDFDITPVEPQLDDVTVNVTNCYASLNNVAKITAKVTVDGQDYPFNDVDYSAEGTYSFTVPGDDLTKGEVSSVVLYDDKAIPFEWIDPAKPVAPEDSKVSLDVNENKVAGGSGTAEDPYLVANPRQLDNVRNDLTACYEQIKDIDFAGSCGGTLGEDESGTSVAVFISNGDANARFKGDASAKAYGWKPIGEMVTAEYFTGTYDGGSKTITGLVSDYQYREDEGGNLNGLGIGLFGAVQGASFKNINLQDCQVIGYQYVGSICGFAMSVSLDKCMATTTNIYGETGIGGLVGFCQMSGNCDNTISACTFQGNVTVNMGFSTQTPSLAGGIVGILEAYDTVSTLTCKISNCTVEGFVGGNNNTTTCQLARVGGIAGSISSRDAYDGAVLTNNVNRANVQGYQYVGGIVGVALSSITLDNCQNYGSITNTIPSGASTICGVGGVIGYTQRAPQFANGTTSKGTISVATDAKNIGGIVGQGSDWQCQLTDLKAAMQNGNVAEPSGMVTSSSTLSRGQYSGSPNIDSLD